MIWDCCISAGVNPCERSGAGEAEEGGGGYASSDLSASAASRRVSGQKRSRDFEGLTFFFYRSI